MTGNRSGFQAMLQQARAEAKKFAGDLGKETASSWKNFFSAGNLAKGVAGFLGFEAIKNSIESLIEKGKEIRELSEQFDISTDAVQKWEKATGKAGVTFNLFARALEAIRQKRQAAGQDFKNLEPFQRLGISRETVLGNSPDDQILMQILRSKDRAAINDLIPRGARLKGALPFLNTQSPTLSEDDVKQLSEVEHSITDLKSRFQRWNAQSGLGRLAINLSRGNSFWKSLARSVLKFSGDIPPDSIGGRGQAGEGMIGPGIFKALRAAREDEEDRRINTAEAEAKAAKEAKEYADKRTEAEHRLVESERENMSIADRRRSIEEEIFDVKKRIKDLDIYGPLTKEEEMEKLHLQARQAGLIHELKQKPMNFSADSLAKVGLYSASSLSFNPVLGIQQAQLNELRGIHNALVNRRGPQL